MPWPHRIVGLLAVLGPILALSRPGGALLALLTVLWALCLAMLLVWDALRGRPRSVSVLGAVWVAYAVLVSAAVSLGPHAQHGWFWGVGWLATLAAGLVPALLYWPCLWVATSVQRSRGHRAVRARRRAIREG